MSLFLYKSSVNNRVLSIDTGASPSSTQEAADVFHSTVKLKSFSREHKLDMEVNMKMESTSSEPESNGPITIYRIIQWPAHLLGSRIPQTYSSHDVFPELSQSPPQMFEIAQTRDGIVTTSNLPENPAYLANKILQKIMERRALKKRLRSGSTASEHQMCPYCRKSYDNPAHWRRHVNMHTGEVKYPCPLCGKIFLDKSTLSRHKKIHSGEKPWKCKMCDKCFHTLPSLRRHITVHNPAGRPFECEICQKRFPDRSSQQKHLFIHTGLRPHICSVCKKSFVHLGDLNCHMKIHAKTKEFICPHCKKEFAKLGNYQRHVQIHGGNIAYYQCPVCHIGYNFRSSLTRHMLVHRQETLRRVWIICRFCNAKFSNRSVLKRHLLLHFAETEEQQCQIGVQNNNFKSKDCDSKNDVNKRPLTHKEINFVRKNLKFCNVVQLNRYPKNGNKTMRNNEVGSEIILHSSEIEKNGAVENIIVDSGGRILPSGNSDKGRNPLPGIVDQVSKVNTQESDNITTLQKKRRGRPRRLHENSPSSCRCDIGCSSEQAGIAKFKSKEFIVGKCKRGRLRKLVNNPPSEKAVTDIEHNEVLSKLIEVCCDDVEQKNKRGRPRRNLGIVPNKQPQIQENKNSECILKRKRGRPRKEMNVCCSTDKHEIQPKDSKLESKTSISEQTVEQKRKRGRPRKALCTFPDRNSNQIQPQVVNIQELLMEEISESVTKQNHKICEGERNENINEEMHFIGADENLSCEGTKNRSENLKTADYDSTTIDDENEQQSELFTDLREMEPMYENRKRSTCDDNTSKIRPRRKQIQPKHILLHSVSDNECLQNNGKVNDGATVLGKAEIFDDKIGMDVSRDSNLKKRGVRHKGQICDAVSLQEKVVTEEKTKTCSKKNRICNTNTGDLVQTVLVGTKNVEKKAYSITLTSENMINIDSGDKKNLSKKKAKRKIPVFVIRGDEVITDYSTGVQSNKPGIFVDETEREENYEQARRNSVSDSDIMHFEYAKQQELSPSSEIQEIPQIEYLVTRVENQHKRTKPEHQTGYFQFQDCGEVTTDVQELRPSHAGAAGAFVRHGIKEVLLDDWQSDDSQSSGSLEIVWESAGCDSV